MEPPSRSAMDAALGLLARRDHGQRELERKLAQRGHTAEDIAAALSRCRELGYLDEARLIEARVQRRIEEGHGPLRIRSELAQRGLSGELIAAALDALDEDWAQRARRLLESRYPDLSTIDRKEYARRGRFLAQRGFAPEHIHRALRR